jgi:hypothetical protein
MARVTVLVLHSDLGSPSEPLSRILTAARRRLADHHLERFLAAGADAVELVGGPPDDTPFGTRLRALVGPLDGRGVVVLGSGALPLATTADRRAFLAVARAGASDALVNDRYSADVLATGRADLLRDVPPGLETDNALPRWLAEVAGVKVNDLRARWRLLVDLDSPLDVALVALAGGRITTWLTGSAPASSFDAARAVLGRIADVLADATAELVVAGRTSARTLGWLERRTACRVRALVEERGLRAATAGRPNVRPPASALGLLLDRDGPEALGEILAHLGDAALVDSRILLAHRLGPDERDWPSPEDRFASDLLLADRVADPWLRALTASAVTARIPVALGGHTLVGPGVRLVARAGRR